MDLLVDSTCRSTHSEPADLSQFWVIVVISNPARYKRRYKLYFDFIQMCHCAGVKVVTVELALGMREFKVTDPKNPMHLQLRSVEELWLKENMINLGVKHACAIAPGMGEKVREVAWIDADCRPAMLPRHWFEETWHQLQVYEMVQMWEYMIDLDYHYNPIGEKMPSFMGNYVKYGTPNPELFHKIESKHKECYPHKSALFGRPGLAWAANIDAFNRVGGLIDFAILGAGDYYQAHGLIGTLESARSEYAYGPYMRKMLEWQERASRWIKKDVGFVPGTVYHDFHGRKVNRQYGTRGKILKECKFNPDTDIKYDCYGLLQLETWEPRQIVLRDRIRAYFRARNEDDIMV